MSTAVRFSSRPKPSSWNTSPSHFSRVVVVAGSLGGSFASASWNAVHADASRDQDRLIASRFVSPSPRW
jgi:hypothetical protein